MTDPVSMHHPGIPGLENVIRERTAYRNIWYAKGWRSDDDPGYTGPTDPPAVPSVAQVAAELNRVGYRRGSQGAICFVWDDGWASQYNVVDLFESRGMQTTFAITTGLVDTASYMTTSQVASLEARGHEIAAHGTQHATGLPGRTAAQRATEYTDCLAWFPANGITQPTTWVYTFGGPTGRSDDTDRELWGRVDRVLDTAVGPVVVGQRRDFPQFVARRMHVESDSAQVYDLGRELIEQAARYPVVNMFYVHQYNTGAANTLSEAELTFLLDLCVELDVPVLTARDAMPAYNPLPDSGFEKDPTGWTYVTSGGTGEIVTDTPVVGLPGTKSLHLSAGVGQFVYARHPALVRPGLVYTLSGRYRTSVGLGAATAKIRFAQYDYKATTISSPTTNLAEATTWTRFTVDVTIDANAVMVNVDCLFQPGVAGEAWFDHLCFLPKYAGAFG